LGAWLGVAALMPVLVIATFSGAAFGVFQKIRRGQSDQGYFPFGPFLALAGVLVLFGSSYSRFMQ
jgi:leader peptidase (prepilin peptidase)/N-methyltransferase